MKAATRMKEKITLPASRAKRRAVSKVKAAAPVAPGHMLAEHVPIRPTRRIDVKLFAPEAKQVFLAGSFNNWQADATPLERRGEGLWETQLELKPGEYEYRFVADGQWITDPMAPRFVANPFGDLNAVLKVAPD